MARPRDCPICGATSTETPRAYRLSCAARHAKRRPPRALRPQPPAEAAKQPPAHARAASARRCARARA
ncbi:hypothetical protein WS86_29650 [Burkholderia savannae]|nr:hypothetical protein WS86_29650 [Burkholderia savannae]